MLCKRVFMRFTEALLVFLVLALVCINTYMQTNNTQQASAISYKKVLTQKEELVLWLKEKVNTNDYQVGITLMPKKIAVRNLPSWYNTKKTHAYKRLTKAELVQRAERFVHILNEAVLKKAYTRFGKKLNVVYAIEGERSYKDLHLHFAVGNTHNAMHTLELMQKIVKAIAISGDFMMLNENYNEYKDDISKKYHYDIVEIDSGWMGYITKELRHNNIDNLLFA